MGARAVSFLQKLWRDDAGAVALEYGLILALAAVISVPSFKTLGDKLSFVLDTIAYAECLATEVLCVMVAPD
jgi:Flp pilus assembly pilin Flp